jgi:HlyD family secretion protein
MQFSKRFILIIVIIAIIGAIAYGFRPMPVIVEIAQAVRAPMKVVIEEEGRTRVKERYEITAPVAGYLARIDLAVGDTVMRGQILFSMTPPLPDMLDLRRRAQTQAQVAARESALRMAQQETIAAGAIADLAKSELNRVEKLVKAKHVTQDELDQAQAELRRAAAAQRAAEFNVDVARHELEAARSVLRYSVSDKAANPEQLTINSSIHGAVLKLFRESEGLVQAGQTLLEVGDPKSLEVIVDVLSTDAVKITQGTPVEIKRWGGDEIIRGEVKLVEPIGFTKISALGVEEQRVWVVVEILTPHDAWRRLGDGYRVEAGFIIWRQDNVLQIPTSALFRYQQDWAVFIQRNGVAVRQPVNVGKRNGLVAEITAGLSEGQHVITHPSDDIDDGARIKLR